MVCEGNGRKIDEPSTENCLEKDPPTKPNHNGHMCEY